MDLSCKSDAGTDLGSDGLGSDASIDSVGVEGSGSLDWAGAVLDAENSLLWLHISCNDDSEFTGDALHGRCSANGGSLSS